MKGLIKWFDDAPKIIKIILALPVINICWSVYRLCKSIESGNVLALVLAIILLVAGPAIWWIVDIVAILLTGSILWFK